MDDPGAGSPQELMLLRKLARISGIGTWQLDLETLRLYWTREVYLIHEVDPAIYTPTLETAVAFYAPEGRSAIADAVRRAREHAERWDIELPLITASGRRIWVRSVGEPELRDGRCIGVAGTFEDVTDERRARSALRARNAENRKLATVAENTINAVLITDAADRIEWVNASFTTVTGYRLIEVVGHTPQELLNGADTITTEDYQRGKALREAGAPVTGIELKLYRKDRTPYWVELETRPVWDEDGALTHCVHIHNDITARRQSQEQVEQLAGRLHLIARSTGIGFFDQSVASGQAVWDDDAYALFGFDPSRPPPPHAEVLARVVPADRAPVAAYWEAVLAGNSAVAIDYSYRLPEGIVRRLHQRAQAQRDAQGVAQRVVGIVLDNSDKHAAEQQALAANEWLELAVSATGIGLYFRNFDEPEVVWDQQTRRICGIDPAAPVPDAAQRLQHMHPDDRPAVLAARAAVEQGKTAVIEIEYRWQRPDNGQWRWLRTRRALLQPGADRPMRIVGAILDVTDLRQQSEQRLLLAEQLQLITATGGIGLWSIDPATGAEIWDAATRKLYGLADTDAAPSRTEWRERFLHPDDRARITALGEAFLASGTPYEAEYRIVDASGAVRWLHARAALLHRPDASTRVIGLSFDISARKDAELDLKSAHQKLELATRGAELGIYWRDLAGGQDYWDAQTYRLFGLPVADGAPSREQILAVVHPDDRAAYQAGMAGAATTGGAEDVEVRVVHADGSLRWLLVRGRSECDAAGQLVRLSGVVLDITERKQTEAQLRDALDRLGVATDSAAIGIYIRDDDSGHGYWDERAFALFGLTPRPGAPTRDEIIAALHPADRDRYVQVIAPGAATERPREVEVRIPLPAGGVRWLLIRGRPVAQHNAAPTRRAGVVLDITVQKRAEEQFAQSTKWLQLAGATFGIGFWHVDLESGATWWDAQLRVIFGLPADAAAPDFEAFLALVDPADRDRLRQARQELPAPGERAEFSYRIHRADGQVRQLLTRRAADHDADGRPTKLFGAALDVTDIRRTTSELRTALERLELITSGAGIGHFERQLDGSGVYWSDHMYALYRRPVRAQPPALAELLDWLHADDRAQFMGQWDRILSAGAHIESEYRIQRGDGTVGWLQTRARLDRTDEGTERIIGVAIDITRSKAAESNAAQALSLLELTASTFGVGLWHTDLQSGERYWDQQLKAILGLAGNAPVPTVEAELGMVVEDDRERVQRLRSALPPPGVTLETECRMRRADGTVRHTLARWAAQYDGTGRALRLYGATLDVTDSRRATARLQMATEAAGIGTWERDLLSGVGRWDDLLFDLAGLPRKEQSPAHEQVIALAHPDDRAALAEALQRMAHSDEACAHEFRILHADGSPRHVSLRGRCERDADGRPLRVFGAVVDVTATRAAAEQLNDALQRLRLAADAGGIAAWERNLTTGEGRWDPLLFEFYGLDPNQPVPQFDVLSAQVHPDDLPQVLLAWETLRQSTNPIEVESRVRRSDGSVRHLVSRARSDWRDGKPWRVIGASIDVTASRQAQARLRDALDRLHLAAEAGGIGSWERDLASGTGQWDDTMFRLYGLRVAAAAPSREDVLAMLHPDDVAAAQEAWQRTLQVTHPVEFEYRVRLPDGQWAVHNTRGLAERDARGVALRVVGATIDITASRAAQQHLREFDAWLQLAGNATGIGFFRLGLDGATLYSDRQMRLIYGTDPDGPVPTAAQFLAAVIPEDRAILRQAREQSHLTDEPVEAEYRVRHPDGSLHTVFTRRRLLRDDSGQPLHVAGAAIDVTASRGAEQRLRESQSEQQALVERMQMAADAAGFGIWERDLAAGTAHWDERARQLMGLRPGQPAPVDTDSLLALIHPADHERYLACRDSYADARGTLEIEFRALSGNGQVTNLVSRGKVKRDADGRAVGALGTLVDVTASRSAERAMREANERLALATEAIGLGIWTWDLDADQMNVDQRIRDMLGVGADWHADFASWMALVHPDDAAQARRVYDVALPSTVASGSSTYRIRRGDGEIRHIFEKFVIERDVDGRPRRLHGTNLDITAIRRAEDERDALVERLQLATQTARLGVWERRLPAELEVWDDAMRTIHGIDDPAWVPTRSTWLAMIHPDDRVRVQARLAELEQASGGELEYRIVRPDGGVRHIADRFRIERDADGVLTRKLGVHLDITKMRVAEHERDQLYERMQLVAEAVGLGVWDWDPHAHVSVWNDRMYALFGHTRAGFANLTWLDVVHPDDVERTRLTLDSALAAGGTFEAEFRVLHPSGATRWLASRGRVEHDAARRAVRVIGVNWDITERRVGEQSVRHAERAARELLERMQLTTSAAGMGVWEVDLASGAVYWDSQMYRLYHCEPQDVTDLQADWRRMLHPDDRARVARTVAQSTTDGGPLEVEFRIVLADGSVRYLANRAQIQLRDGRPTRQYGVTWDVTDRRLADAALQAKETAERASAAKSEFLSRMSHELRTPLNAILGFAQILEMDAAEPLAPGQRDRLGQISKAGWHLLALINEILDLSRIEAGATILAMAPVAVAELIDECLTLISADAGKRQLQLRQRELPAAPQHVWADRTRFKQVLLNLLSNAVKYNREAGEITVVHGVAADGSATISVGDSGVGLTAAQLQQLFQPFNRLGLESASIEGTGIGLTIAQKLMEQMGGKLTVSSTPGSGSEFTLTLPVATSGGERAPDILEAAGHVAPAARSDVRGSVLYVEDNAANSALVEQVLALRPNVRLFKAADGASARVLAAVCQPDLILLDMRLPDTDGLTLLRELQALPATAAIACVAVSANALPHEMARARQAGFVDYWTKPIDAARLLRGIDALLAQRPR